VGCQTATTGAAVPQDDVVLSLRGLAGVVDIDPRRRVAEVLPGTITADLKSAVEEAGLFFPPDPTSEQESTVGGNIASNASGARTFRWGVTENWIRGLEVVTGKGEVHRFFRRRVDKNTAGLRPFLEPLALFAGSEGTLGVVTRAWVDLIEHPGPCVAFLLFFDSLDEALELAVSFRAGTCPESPRCVELLDRTALTIVGGHPGAPAIPGQAGACLYVEFDSRSDSPDRVIEACVVPLADRGLMLDDTVVAVTRRERSLLRELRHFVPESCNQEATRFHAAGGLKVATEFCVPSTHLVEMMRFVEETAREAGVEEMVRYGHVGNGHPHVFMRGRNREEVVHRKQLTHRWYARAVELGGTVSGEHGIGKTRRDILRHLYSPALLEAMRQVKRVFDPGNILAIGNIFPETEPLLPEFFKGS